MLIRVIEKKKGYNDLPESYDISFAVLQADSNYGVEPQKIGPGINPHFV